MTGYTKAWIAWLLGFVAIEGIALIDKRKGDTLTEHVAKWASLKSKGKGWRLRRFALLVGLVWLWQHLWSGGEDV